jgi:anhydro-N-acetylmuramic acid kinase
MYRLQALLQPLKVFSTEDFGLDPDRVEAAAFAWLAQQTLNHRPGNIPAVTGARHAVILGAVYPAG